MFNPVKPGACLAATLVAVLCHSPQSGAGGSDRAPADAGPYPVYDEVQRLYQRGLDSEDCVEVETIAELLRRLSKSKAPMPEAVAQEMQVGRAEVGAYVRRVRRMLNQRKSELCPVVPAPCQVEVQPVSRETIDEIHAIARSSRDCELVRGATVSMVAKSDENVADYTLELLVDIQRERPGCFPAGVD